MFTKDVIENTEDHMEVAAELSPLLRLDPALGTPESDRLLHLVALIEAYECRLRLDLLL